MTLADLVLASCYLVEARAIPGQWQRTDYVASINWALVEAAKLSGKTRSLRAGIATTTNILALSPVPIQVIEVRYPAMAKVLLPTTEQTENAIDPGWRYKTGVPTAWFEEAGNQIRLNRMVAGSTNFDVEVLEAPAALVNDTDTVDTRFPDFVIQAIRFGAGYHLYMQAGDNQDEKRAAGLLEQFADFVTGKKPVPPQG